MFLFAFGSCRLRLRIACNSTAVLLPRSRSVLLNSLLSVICALKGSLPSPAQVAVCVVTIFIVPDASPSVWGLDLVKGKNLKYINSFRIEVAVIKLSVSLSKGNK